MAWQGFTGRKQVVRNHSGANGPAPALTVFIDWDRNRKRSHKMRRDFQQGFAFTQGLANKAKFEVLEVAQAAMNEPRRSAASAASQIALVHQQNLQPARRGVASDSGAVDTRADDDHVEMFTGFQAVTRCIRIYKSVAPNRVKRALVQARLRSLA